MISENRRHENWRFATPRYIIGLTVLPGYQFSTSTFFNSEPANRNLNCRGIFVCGRIRTKKSGARLLTNLVAVQKTHISILHIHRHTGVPAHGHAPKPILNACFFQRPGQVYSKYESKSFTKRFENHRNEFFGKN